MDLTLSQPDSTPPPAGTAIFCGHYRRGSYDGIDYALKDGAISRVLDKGRRGSSKECLTQINTGNRSA